MNRRFFCLTLGVMKWFVKLLIYGVAFVAHGENSEWMKAVNDSVKLCDLAILGAHDAATGHGFAGLRGLFVAPFARTQSLGLEEQWAAGVRAFDLRPVANGDDLPIYHGSERTKLTLHDALDIIARLLREHPSETAIILLRQEAPGGDWAELVGRAINDSDLQLLTLTEELTLGGARGQVIILSRDDVTHGDVMRLRGWRHDSVVEVMADNCVRITVQDYYDCRAAGAVERKIAMMEEVNSASGWVINFLSGYTRARSAKSSRQMSATMRERFEALPAARGIIMLDFVGED